MVVPLYTAVFVPQKITQNIKKSDNFRGISFVFICFKSRSKKTRRYYHMGSIIRFWNLGKKITLLMMPRIRYSIIFFLFKLS